MLSTGCGSCPKTWRQTHNSADHSSPLVSYMLNSRFILLTSQKCQYANRSRSLLRDHAGGNVKMVKLMPGLKVYGGDDRVDAITKKVSHSHNFKVRPSNCLFWPVINHKWLMFAHWCHSFPAWITQRQMPVYTVSHNWAHLLLCDKRKQHWAASCFHRYV